jgi:hypothetical protein
MQGVRWFRAELDCSYCSQQSNPQQKCKNMKTLQLRKLINRSPLRHGLLLIALALISFGISPKVAAQGVPGRYELSFCADGVPIGSTLFVGQELALHAYVADSLGVPASSGYVVFQVCTRRGRAIPKDPQPSSACNVDTQQVGCLLHSQDSRWMGQRV